MKIKSRKNKSKRKLICLVLSLLVVIALGITSLNQPAIRVYDTADPAAVSGSTGSSYAEVQTDEAQDEESEDEEEADAEEEPAVETALSEEAVPQEETVPEADPDMPEEVEETKEEETQEDVTVSDEEQADDESVPSVSQKEAEQEQADPSEGTEETAAEEKASGKSERAARKEKKSKTSREEVKAGRDTSGSDSDNDAAPVQFNTEVTYADTAAVIGQPNSPDDAGDISGSQIRASGMYNDILKDEYKVEFSDDFALIMEEIEDRFEFENGIISEKTLEQRLDSLDKGVVFGFDSSSAYAKTAAEDEILFCSEHEIKLFRKLVRQEKKQAAVEAIDDTIASAVIGSYHYRNWPDILAVYAKRQLQAGAETVQFNKQAIPALTVLFKEMNSVSVIDEENCVAEYTNRTVDDYLTESRLSEDKVKKIRESFEKYTDADFVMMAAAQTGSRQLTLAAMDLQDEEKAEKFAKEHEDSEEPDDAQFVPLSDKRRSVALAAQTLIGKIHYFWGGKYNFTGWNKDWSTPQVVSSAGCSDTGKEMLYGLDCSGFVSWCFVNGFNDTEAAGAIGQGTASQWVLSDPVSDEDARVGDLVFLRVPSAGSINHVGVLIGRDADGNWLAVHCNGSDDTVSVDRAYDAGFRYLRTPLIYGETAPVQE